MLLQAIRSIVFYALFLGQTLILAITLTIMAGFHKGWFPLGAIIVRYWCRSNLFLLRWIVGIKSEFSGMENIPEGGCIIASKHQSDWDIFALFPMVNRPSFIAKKELMDIPFFGHSARAMDAIQIDRKRGGSAISEMNVLAKAAIDRGCQLIIYPEGTRTKALTTPGYKFGASKLYDALNVPMVPVALNSGLFWARNSLILWPGTAKVQFLPPIMPGLPAKQAHQEMMNAIETTSDKLVLEAAEEGLRRPLSPSDHERLAALRTKYDQA